MDLIVMIRIVVCIATRLISVPVKPWDWGEADADADDDHEDEEERKGGGVVIDWGDCSKDYGRRRR